MKRVVKRTGEIVAYDRGRIESAVGKAFDAAEGGKDVKVSDLVARDVEDTLNYYKGFNGTVTVEEIQDAVEMSLMSMGLFRTAKAYILYRARHDAIRDARRVMLDIDSTMDGYLERSDWRVNENSNVGYSLGGLILHNSGAVTANYWLKNIYPPEIAEAHRTCAFHIHDLSMLSSYCAGHSLRQLIREGLGGVKDKAASKPARHLSTLCQQMVNFLGVMQNEWAGAQAFSSFDTCLAPFVKAERLTYREVKQCIQSFIFGVNTPSRWGSQAPFTNITLDWACPRDMASIPAVVGGEDMPFTYGECRREMDMVNKAFIEIMLEGDANGRGFQYPIPTYNITDDFEWDSPNARLLFKMTMRYGTPYFANFINSDMDPSDVRSMCCRLRLDKRELRRRGGGLFGSDEFTGSIGVVTINLPQIGYLSKTEDDYFERLDRLMCLARDSLEIKRKVLTRLLDGGLYPYTKRYLGHFNNHFSTIGICGMNESLLNFMGKDITSDEGMEFALRVLDRMRERMQDFQEETGNLYNLEATPAEGTSYRLARHDKERFHDIITAGKDEPYYTNSTQLPVGYTSDVFDALDMQDALQSRYTGGTVFHVFLGEQAEWNWQGCRQLVQSIARSYRIPYFSITPTFSICPVHGYLEGEHFECPICKTEETRKLMDMIDALKSELKEASDEA